MSRKCLSHELSIQNSMNQADAYHLALEYIIKGLEMEQNNFGLFW
jgi:hypothetical protein